MPFDFDSYTKSCRTWDDDVLQEEYQRYVKQASEGSTGAAVCTGLAIFTFGASLFKAAASYATFVNAVGKLEIIKNEMARRSKKKHKLTTRPEDIAKGLLWGSTGLITTPVGHVVGPALMHATSSGATFYHGTPDLRFVER